MVTKEVKKEFMDLLFDHIIEIIKIQRRIYRMMEEEKKFETEMSKIHDDTF